MLRRRKHREREFNEELDDQWSPPDYDGYTWPVEQHPYWDDTRPEIYTIPRRDNPYGQEPEDIYEPEDEVYVEHVTLADDARRLPTFKNTTRAMGIRGLIYPPSLSEREKANRIDRVKVDFDEAMNIIERDYNAAVKELHNQHRAFDDRELRYRRPVRV
jgi:hypothetical protein